MQHAKALQRMYLKSQKSPKRSYIECWDSVSSKATLTKQPSQPNVYLFPSLLTMSVGVREGPGTNVGTASLAVLRNAFNLQFTGGCKCTLVVLLYKFHKIKKFMIVNFQGIW